MDGAEAYRLVKEFAILFAVVFATVVVLFAASSLVLEAMNRRHPERKIQAGRINRHKWRELRRAPGSIAVVAGCFSFGLFAQREGWTPTPLEATWWSVPLWVGIGIVLYDAWFYWTHRLGHTERFYRLHACHHGSPTPTPWTNHFETVGDAFLYQSFYAILPFVLPIPPIAFVAHKIYDQVTGVLGHAGYEHFASRLERRPWPLANTVFHDQHHSGFKYNFGHSFSVWDRVFGTLHPKYDETTAAFEKVSAETRR